MILLRKYKPKYLTMHDTWIHRVALYTDTQIISDENKYIDYRQHADNVIGIKKDSFIDKIKKVKYNKHKTQKIAKEIIDGYADMINSDKMDFLNLIIKEDVLSKIKLATTNFDIKIKITTRIKLVFKILFNII